MKMKRFASLIASITVLTTCLSAFPSVGAENAEAKTKAGLQVSAGKNIYSEYISKNTGAELAEKNITIDAVNYIESIDSTLEKIVIDGKTALKWTNENGSVVWNFNVEKSALYALSYYTLKGRESPIQLGVKLDGQYPFDEARNIHLSRLFENDGETRRDGIGNEFAPEQKEVFRWQEKRLCNTDGDYSGEYLFYLTAGAHTLTFELNNEPAAFGAIAFCPPEKEAVSYHEYAKQHNGEAYNGKPIVIEGENAFLKSDNSLVAKSDGSDPSVKPNDSYCNKINYIGGNWKNVGDTLVWKVKVEKSAWYKIGFHARQNTVLNGLCYRSMKIDGETLFDEMNSIGFGYAAGWEFSSLKASDGRNALVYLKEGDHQISMTVTLGDMTDTSRELADVVYELGEIYRDMVRITGEDPDDNRSYDLFNQIPDLEQRLKTNIDTIKKLADRIEALTGSKGGTAVATMRAMTAVMERMVKYDYQAHQYVQNFYTNYSSTGALVYEMRSMPVDLDAIYLMAPEGDFDELSASFFEKTIYTCLRFFASFAVDYSSISSGAESDKGSLDLWVNWGLDQSRVLNSLIESSFTRQSGISVSVKVTNATVVQAILSGNSPDMVLNISRSEPVNLAMRGALYDLTQFDDYNEIKKRFMPSAVVPFEFKDGVYALPDTQSFYTLFYRTDIFEELGLTVPATWEEFLAVSAVIQRNNMSVGMPYTQITAATQINAGSGSLSLFPTILLQYGGRMYNDNHTEITFDEAPTITAFDFWTSLYTDYSFPVTYDFYNRFRVGTMPMGIQLYTMHNTVSVLAPEIEGRWAIAKIPGIKQADGTIKNTQAGGSTGCVILNNSDNIEGAWEFIKWWTSADTQYRYTSNVESILGATARTATSTVEALSMLSWSKKDLEVLHSSWEDVEEIAEIPGGYYVPRAVDQCFWNVIYNSRLSNDVLAEWKESVDDEISEMRNAYGLDG